jgi:hypothetical protein
MKIGVRYIDQARLLQALYNNGLAAEYAKGVRKEGEFLDLPTAKALIQQAARGEIDLEYHNLVYLGLNGNEPGFFETSQYDLFYGDYKTANQLIVELKAEKEGYDLAETRDSFVSVLESGRRTMLFRVPSAPKKPADEIAKLLEDPEGEAKDWQVVSQPKADAEWEIVAKLP